MPTKIRIFCSSPSDVSLERQQVAAVVQELNTTLRALVPERETELDLIRWETHTHPDIGFSPQDVIDEQLGTANYDLFVGMMWSRFGTPTSTLGSGTEHEFRQAYAGWEECRRPSHILFYVCNEQYPARVALKNARQLEHIEAFRVELMHKGLIGSYETHTAFADTLRPDLVRAVSEILRHNESPAAIARGATPREKVLIRERVAVAAQDYEQIRASMPSGDARTRRMEVVASTMRTLAQSTIAILPELTTSASPGERLAAITTLEAIPDIEYLGWLSERVRHEKPFVGYHAAVALVAAAREANAGDLAWVSDAVEAALSYASRLPKSTDRATTLEVAANEVRRRSVSAR